MDVIWCSSSVFNVNVEHITEPCLEHSQKSTMELFREIVLSEMFDWVLNMPPHKAQHAADQSTAFTWEFEHVVLLRCF